MTSHALQWGIFKANLDPVAGSEEKGTRPVLVISAEDFNRVMPVVTVLPLTSLKPGRKVYPNEVLLRKGTAGLLQDSLVLVYQIRTISKGRLGELYGHIDDKKARDLVRKALRFHLDMA